MLEHVAEPGALVLVHPPDEPARLLVGATVLGEAGQRLDEAVDEGRSKLARGPGLELAEVELQPDDREAGEVRRADVNGTIEDAHAVRPVPGKSGRS